MNATGDSAFDRWLIEPRPRVSNFDTQYQQQYVGLVDHTHGYNATTTTVAYTRAITSHMAYNLNSETILSIDEDGAVIINGKYKNIEHFMEVIKCVPHINSEHLLIARLAYKNYELNMNRNGANS